MSNCVNLLMLVTFLVQDIGST